MAMGDSNVVTTDHKAKLFLFTFILNFIGIADARESVGDSERIRGRPTNLAVMRCLVEDRRGQLVRHPRLDALDALNPTDQLC